LPAVCSDDSAVFVAWSVYYLSPFTGLLDCTVIYTHSVSVIWNAVDRFLLFWYWVNSSSEVWWHISDCTDFSMINRTRAVNIERDWQYACI